MRFSIQKRGFWTALGALGVYALDPILTIVRLNVEVWAAANGYDNYLVSPKLGSFAMTVMDWAYKAWEFLSGDFALGFAAAALILALWDPIARYRAKGISAIELGTKPIGRALYSTTKTLRVAVGLSITNTSTSQVVPGIEVTISKIFIGDVKTEIQGSSVLSLLARPDVKFDLNPETTKHIGVVMYYIPEPEPAGFKLDKIHLGPFGGYSTSGHNHITEMPPNDFEIELMLSVFGYAPRFERFTVKVINENSVTIEKAS